MPTTKPLERGDDTGGQLKPIAAFTSLAAPRSAAGAPASVVAAAQAAAAAQRVAAQAAAQPQPAQAAAPSVQHVHAATSARRTSLGAPRLSLKGQPANQAPQNTAKATDAPGLDNPFTDSEFMAAWNTYIDQHATHHLLINTMRAAPPKRSSDSTFTMTVESDIQVELMANAMNHLLDFMHNKLNNNTFKLIVQANAGASAPSTWNDREALADMMTRHPALKTLIAELGLVIS